MKAEHNIANKAVIENERIAIKRQLMQVRHIEIAVDDIIAPYLGLDSLRLFQRGARYEGVDDSAIECIKTFNKIAKRAGVEPLKKNSIEPVRENISRAKKIVDWDFILNRPDEILYILGKGM